MGEGVADRQTETERQIQTERQIETETKTDRQTDRQTEGKGRRKNITQVRIYSEELALLVDK